MASATDPTQVLGGTAAAAPDAAGDRLRALLRAPTVMPGRRDRFELGVPEFRQRLVAVRRRLTSPPPPLAPHDRRHIRENAASACAEAAICRIWQRSCGWGEVRGAE